MLDLVIQLGVRLPDGRQVRPFDQVTGGPVPGFSFPVRLPAGSLSGMGLRPGDLVGLSGTVQGHPELAPVGAVDGDLLGPMLVRRLGVESVPLPVDVVVIAALALEQWPGGVQPPISRAAADAGLECDDRHIAPLGVPLGAAGGVGRDARDLAEAYELGRDEARVVAAALALVDLGERVAGELAGSVLDELDVADLDPDDLDSWVRAHLQGPGEELFSRHEQSAREVLEGHEIDVGQLVAGLADPYCALVVAEEALEGFRSAGDRGGECWCSCSTSRGCPDRRGPPWTTCGAGSWSSSKGPHGRGGCLPGLPGPGRRPPGCPGQSRGHRGGPQPVPGGAQPDRPGWGRRQPPGGHIPH